MATGPEQPWTNHEKNYLMAEIIKAANPSTELFMNMIRFHNILPRWDEIPLPPGRSLNSCRNAFEDLQRAPSVPGSTPLGPNTPLSAPGPLKRPYQIEGPYSAGAAGREIRPKPPTFGPGYLQPSPNEPPPKRKRGRPRKVDTQAKAELEAAAAQARSDPGEIRYVPGPSPYPRPFPQTSLQSSASSSAGPAGVGEAKPALPPTTTAKWPIAAMLTPTTREEPKNGSHSSSSSGKRRRARSAKSEPEEPSPGMRQGSEYQSSSSRVRGAPEDSPARAAVLRHTREGPGEQTTDQPQQATYGTAGPETTEEPREPRTYPPASSGPS